jgi:hypothetical protein
MSGAAGAAIGAAVIGAGGTIYGANQQSKATKGAAADQNAANAAAAAESNRLNWSNYLISRGIAPTADTPIGVLPSSNNYTAINAKLPIWARAPKAGLGRAALTSNVSPSAASGFRSALSPVRTN